MCAAASCGWIFPRTHEWRLGICLHHCPPSRKHCAGWVYLSEVPWDCHILGGKKCCARKHIYTYITNRWCKMCLQTSAGLIRTSPFFQIGGFLVFIYLFFSLCLSLSQGLSSKPYDQKLWRCVISHRTHTFINARPLQMYLFNRRSSVCVTRFFLLVKFDKPVPAGLPSLDKMPVDVWRPMIREEVVWLN